jgi:hypothetical protein
MCLAEGRWPIFERLLSHKKNHEIAASDSVVASFEVLDGRR